MASLRQPTMQSFLAPTRAPPPAAPLQRQKQPLPAASPPAMSLNSHPPAMSLNGPQLQAAEHAGEGLLVVESGPGSGKTRVITARVRYLLAVRGVQAHRILVLTFSNKAAAELRARIGQIATDIRVCTFHAFCAWLLKRFGTAIGVPPDFRTADQAEQQRFLRELSAGRTDGDCGGEGGVGDGSVKPATATAADVDADDEEGPSGRFKEGALERIMDFKRRRALEAWKGHGHSAASSGGDAGGIGGGGGGSRGGASSEEDEMVAHWTEQYERWLASRNALDFDDLQLVALKLLQHDPSGRLHSLFSHVLIDEFQDTSAIQCALVTELVAPPHGSVSVRAPPVPNPCAPSHGQPL